MGLLDTAVWHGKIFINEWTDGGGGTSPVIEPATSQQLADQGFASIEDVARASAAAARAQAEWALRPPEERAGVLRRAGQLFEQYAEEIRWWIQRETGAIAAKAGLETHVAANECFEASALPTLAQGEVLSSNDDRWSFARRRPLGVVSVIAPFNFPLILSIRAVAPALATGNAVLLKPDPRTTVSGGYVLARIFEEAGLPAGLLQLTPGGGDIGAAVVEAPEVKMVAFTGSTAAGRKVGETCSRLLKRAHLELGGKNAMIVLEGAGVDKAASAAAFGSFLHQGQICMTAGRHIVHDSVYDEYVSALADKAKNLPVGDPTDAGTVIGPIIDEKQLARVDGIVQDAVAQGATILAGGEHSGPFYSPTVLTNLTPENIAWREEIFGPVAPVMRFSDLEEAISLANDTDYGLSIGILGDVGEAMKIADRVVSGKIHINEQTVSDEAHAPFGGFKSSGNGTRIGGATVNLEAFTEIQWLTMRPEIAPYPF
ncbi:benzaldehyde dehydrogenase [Nesterenkonia flava]|uniref:Benzaldehyde dehydrogenase n=1 Tax=Nesterenkonia flava TaxID=469799 RepID=A0ABU1FPP8_9MICC|nr:benzaldehyde dehydrogenase [Nesterenkonia flava]MDR5710622.1 benzaldehyde dehydrogenase [Nesterenkonia flava]